MSSLGMPGDVKRVSEARYPSRVREAALNQERADDAERLAELEDYVRRHRKSPPSPQDFVDLHDDDAKSAASKPRPARAKEPPAKPPSPKREGEHLDITI